MEFTWESLHCSWSLRGTWGHDYILTPHIPVISFSLRSSSMQLYSVRWHNITLKNVARTTLLSLQQLSSQNRYSFHWVNRNAGNWGNKLLLLLWIQNPVFLPLACCNWSIIWFSVSGSLYLSVLIISDEDCSS